MLSKFDIVRGYIEPHEALCSGYKAPKNASIAASQLENSSPSLYLLKHIGDFHLEVSSDPWRCYFIASSESLT